MVLEIFFVTRSCLAQIRLGCDSFVRASAKKFEKVCPSRSDPKTWHVRNVLVSLLFLHEVGGERNLESELRSLLKILRVFRRCDRCVTLTGWQRVRLWTLCRRCACWKIKIAASRLAWDPVEALGDVVRYRVVACTVGEQVTHDVADCQAVVPVRAGQRYTFNVYAVGLTELLLATSNEIVAELACATEPLRPSSLDSG